MLGARLVYIGANLLDETLVERLTVTQELNRHWWCEFECRQTKDVPFPVEDSLGKPLTVATLAEDDAEVVIFQGIIVEGERTYEIWGSMGARLRAVTLSYLLDLTPRRAYYYQSTPNDVALRLAGAAGLEWGGSLEGKALSYVQLGQTDFDYLVRLADDCEKWIRPTWSGIEVRDSFDGGITLKWREEHGLLEFSVKGSAAPAKFTGSHYDYRVAESLTDSDVGDQPATFGSAGRMVGAALDFAGKLPTAASGRRSRLMDVTELEDRLKKESRRSLANSVVARGVSLDQGVKAGGKITVEGPLDAAGDYGVVRASHMWTARGYENEFYCTPAAKYTDPVPPPVPRAEGVYPARVTDNNDPQNLGRVQVQYFWQEDSHTAWARVMTAHAGADRGILFLPEVGDEVWVMFEEGDPERPRVVGATWNGVHKPPREPLWGGDTDANDVKRIVTKSGHRITLSDKDGHNSIVIATPEHLKMQLIEGSNETGDSMLALHSDGDIFLSAPNGRVHFHSKFFSREVGGGGGSAISGPTTATPIASVGGGAPPKPIGTQPESNVEPPTGAATSIKIDSRQLQKKFKHAGDFGIDGNWSSTTAGEYEAALQRHVSDPATKVISGTYRGKQAIHYVNPKTGLNVITDSKGTFVSGWKLNPDQLNNVLTRGSL
jgi:uncharacterized protein involved in type VI secretion and phage assembly